MTIKDNIQDARYAKEIAARRTLAIISHPDAGKTTITEKMLLFGQAMPTSGNVQSRISRQQAKSDWMAMEKQRGISITTSVMQFNYRQKLINLLDTPGHEDFSEDTYRTLTAVDCCLMVIDAAKGVEARTRKLIEVTRLRETPIITFVNKVDRDIRDPMELLDEVESELCIFCAPITWPIGCGKLFKGIYHLDKNETSLYHRVHGHTINTARVVKGLYHPEPDQALGELLNEQLKKELDLVRAAYHTFNQQAFLTGELTPVFFGTALGNFGVDHMLDGLVAWAPPPMPRHTDVRVVRAEEDKFTGFVFKIQANMDQRHRDRVAFVRIVSGRYEKNMKLHQVRTGKDVIIANAMTFMASSRANIAEAYAGDIIGLPNHGNLQIGDAFTKGEKLKFTGISHFAPELFRRIRLLDPLKHKQLLKGLVQLAEEGAVHIFRPMANNDLIVGVVGVLQFDVVVARLKSEYQVEARYESVSISTARWVECNDAKKLEAFKRKNALNLALDGSDHLSYIATSIVNLNLTQERYPYIQFRKIREH